MAGEHRHEFLAAQELVRLAFGVIVGPFAAPTLSPCLNLRWLCNERRGRRQGAHEVDE